MNITESQTLAIINATRPLQPQERVSFMTALETLLAGRHEIGDGELRRALCELQKKHFRPPDQTAWG